MKNDKLRSRNEEIQQYVVKILHSFDSLRKILKEKAICEDNTITVFDPPFRIQIMKVERLIQLCYNDDILATASPNSFNACDDEAKDVLESWLKTLNSIGYKRFLIKKD